VRVKIDDEIWTVQDAVLLGVCLHGPNTVVINPLQSDKKRLDTVIHEMVHATRPKMCEENVSRVAAACSAVLWKDGWRRRARARRKEM